MGGRLVEGPTMAKTTLNWEAELRGWLEPFLERLGHKARRRMCPLYVSGLIGPGDRKSVQPMAERLAPNDYDQLHHFIAGGVWDLAPLQALEVKAKTRRFKKPLSTQLFAYHIG